jgi:hypothetical protein
MALSGAELERRERVVDASPAEAPIDGSVHARKRHAHTER